MKKSFLKDSLSNYAVFGLQMAIGVVAIPVYIATYGDTLYGVYLLSIGLASSLLFLEFGSGRAILRYTAEYLNDGQRDKFAHALQTCLWITAITSALLAAVFIALAHVQSHVFNIDAAFAEEAYYLFLGTGGYAFLLVVAQLPQSMLKGAGIFYLRNRLVVVELALRALALWLVWYYQLTIYFLLASEVALVTTALFFDFAILRRHVPELLDGSLLRARTGRPIFRGEVFKYAKETFTLSVIGFFNQQTDKIIIGFFLDVRFVTVYAIIVKPYAVVKSVTAKTFVVFQPYYVSIQQQRGVAALRDFVVRFSLLLNLVATVALFGLILALPTLVYYWLGTREYDDYLVYGQLLVAAFAIKTLSSMPNGVLYITGETARLVRLELVAIVFNLALSIGLVQYIGVGGVLMGTFLPLLLSTPYLLRIAGEWFRESSEGRAESGGGLRPLYGRFLVNVAGMFIVVGASVWLRYAFAERPGDTDLFALALAAGVTLIGAVAFGPGAVREFRALRKAYL